MSNPIVSVGLRAGRVFVIPTYSPGPGTYVKKEPVGEASPADPRQIGMCVLDGLSNFHEGGEMPDWTVYRSPVLTIAGVKSWADYERGLKDCVVDASNGRLYIRSERHDPIELDAAAVPEEIGNAVLISLATSPAKSHKKNN